MSDTTAPTAATAAAVTLPPSVSAKPDPKAKAIALLTPQLEALGWKIVSATTSSVLQAACTTTVSFSTLASFLELSKTASKDAGTAVEPMITSIGTKMMVSTRIGAKRQRTEENPNLQGAEDKRDKIRATLSKLAKADAGGPPKSEIDRATKVLDAAVCQLMGVGGCEERAVQSYGIFFKKLAPSDPRNRIVLAFRLHAGTPVRLQDLKSCLGECWADGAITSSDTVSGVDSVALPLTDEGALSLEHGNAPLLVVTSVNPSPSS